MAVHRMSRRAGSDTWDSSQRWIGALLGLMQFVGLATGSCCRRPELTAPAPTDSRLAFESDPGRPGDPDADSARRYSAAWSGGRQGTRSESSGRPLVPTPRPRSIARLTIKSLVLGLALVGAYLLRFDGAIPADHLDQLRVLLPAVVAIDVLALHVAGVGRQSWQYTTLKDVVEITVSLAVVSGGLLAVRVLSGGVGGPGLGVLAMPLGVIGANFILSLLGLFAVRMARRLQAEGRDRRFHGRGRTGAPASRRVLLIGAGRAGVMMARELQRRPDLGMTPVAFLDDDVAKVGRRVAGLDVVGTVDDVGRVAEARRVDEAIITITALARPDIRRIVDRCSQAGVATKIVPGLYEIVSGDVRVSRIRDVDVDDLLGRDQVELDDRPTSALLTGRCVMVTGAGGSIGSELARQVAGLKPSRLVVLDQAEPALWAIHRELTGQDPTLEVVPVIADVCDRVRMSRVFADLRPDVVAHAAAHKHVPLMESNPGEAVKNNVGGTRVVADLAADYAVERFVLVSTDKAVNPTSVMGATKRLAERYVQHLAETAELAGVAVRFGNVLGSTGSVVPIFKEQVAAGGPVTVTHPEMTRYFMTIPEASQLVLQAAAIGRPGETLVLDMGEPVRIVDLAESVIRLSGFEPHTDIAIEFTGLRPGEKLYEELALTDENATRTRHPKIWIGIRRGSRWPLAARDVASLLAACDGLDPADVRSRLVEHVPEYAPATRVDPRGHGHTGGARSVVPTLQASFEGTEGGP